MSDRGTRAGRAGSRWYDGAELRRCPARARFGRARDRSGGAGQRLLARADHLPAWRDAGTAGLHRRCRERVVPRRRSRARGRRGSLLRERRPPARGHLRPTVSSTGSGVTTGTPARCGARRPGTTASCSRRRSSRAPPSSARRTAASSASPARASSASRASIPGCAGTSRSKRRGRSATVARGGKPRALGRYDGDGARWGVWWFWYPNGQLAREVEYESGVRTHGYREWYEDGHCCRTDGSYLGGRKDSHWRRSLDPNGRLVEDEEYRDGRPLPPAGMPGDGPVLESPP